MAKKERELPAVLEHDFIITDESVNRYGWRLLVGGIDLTGFILNPVCCVQHATSMIPVGKWKNLKVEGQTLKGTVEFDRNDDEAVRLYWKYKDGYMNAVSLNVIPIEESDDPEYLIPGQKYATLIKSEMLEISLVTLPGQKNAVKLSTPEGGEYKLNLLTKNSTMAEEKKTVEQLQAELDANRKLTAKQLVQIHKGRGVVADGEIESLEKLAFSDYETTERMLNARPAPSNPNPGTSAEALADTLVRLHFDRGAITEGEKAVYKLFALSNYDAAKRELEAKAGKDGIQSFVLGMNNGQATTPTSGTDPRADWDYYRYFKEDPQALALMEQKEPEKYKKLASDFQRSIAPDGVVI